MRATTDRVRGPAGRKGLVIVSRSMVEVDRVEAARDCDRFDYVWVPSAQSREAFLESGLSKDRVKVLPEAVDTSAFSCRSAKVQPPFRSGAKALDDFLEHKPKQSFTFLSMFKWEPRKNWYGLLESFLDAFPEQYTSIRGPNGESRNVSVRLLVKTQILGWSPDDPRQDVPDLLQEKRLSEGSLEGRLLVFHDFLSSSEIPKLFKAVDGFILPTHGEGWGLPLIEAMASGVPTISTGWGGHMDFMSKENSWPVSYDLVASPNYGARWAEPRKEALMEVSPWRPEIRHMLAGTGSGESCICSLRHEEFANRNQEGPLTNDIFLNPNCVVLAVSSTPWLASPAAPSSTMGTRHPRAAADADTAASSAAPVAPAPRPRRPRGPRRGLRAWGRSIKRRVRGCLGLEPAPSIHPAVAPVIERKKTSSDTGGHRSYRALVTEAEAGGVPAAVLHQIQLDAEREGCLARVLMAFECRALDSLGPRPDRRAPGLPMLLKIRRSWHGLGWEDRWLQEIWLKRAVPKPAETGRLVPSEGGQSGRTLSSKKFKARRTHPVRAFETLSPYAVLEVGIMAARDLTERESGFFNTDTTPDPYVQVLLDDTELEKCKTLPARRMKDPTWMYQCEVDVLAPTSMVRIQVKDDRPTEKADIGFFDVCLGDIPYDKVIEGWFELRFQESLLTTSVQRYQQHCEMREETLTEEEALRKKKDLRSHSKIVYVWIVIYYCFLHTVLTQELASAPPVVPAADPDDKQTKLVTKTQLYAESKDRAMDAFQACVHSTADISDQMGLETISKSLREGGRKKRSNAGEVYISLRLKLLVSRFDSLFAYAMDAPSPENLGGLKQDVKITRKIDVQRVYDDIMEVKVRVLDDAVLCCAYGFRYLVTWRSLPLSAIYLVGLLLCCWKTYLTWAIIPLLLAISLIVNRFPSARSYMTRGGQNAALTEEGFKHTAAWRDSAEVLKYVTRVLKEDMKAKLTDPRHFHH
eukprot:s728_g12.t2